MTQNGDRHVQLGQFIFGDRIETTVPQGTDMKTEEKVNFFSGTEKSICLPCDGIFSQSTMQIQSVERPDASTQTFFFANLPGDKQWTT